ncbi:hypothetical protein [Kutzneria albida]|uniref:hypothetical protein n=1 Tax=Kutzneria albida TaxID=43357 RepID=UPI0011DC85F3|nr:hypothetical protein [Kutzneria albida]
MEVSDGSGESDSSSVIGMSPKGLGIMTLSAVSVAPFSLTVSAVDTLRVVLEGGDTARGQLLHDALTFATSEHTAHPVAGDAPVRPQFPRVAADGSVVDVARLDAQDVVTALVDTGYLTARPVWSEPSHDAYLDQGRTVLVIHVLRQFTLTTTTVSGQRDRTVVTPVGWYLLALVGDHTSSLVGATGVDFEDAEAAGNWLVEQEEFGAAHCAAGCDCCGNRWQAEAGEGTFTPDEGDATLVWHFDDAKDVDEERNTIACPACGIGRVGFDIY